MPTKGTTLQTGKRLNIINYKLWKKFCEETKEEITYLQFSDIITESNEIIKQKILNNTTGFRCPEGFGHFTVTRYKSKKRAIDYKKSKEHNTTVYYTNFHSYGYSSKVKWNITGMTDIRNLNLFKFIPERTLSRGIARKIIDEKKIYNEDTYNFLKGKVLKLNIDKLQKIKNGNIKSSNV